MAISAQHDHTCALLDNGSVSCWGRNTWGQLGDGTTIDRDTPTQTASLGAGRTAVAISAHYSSTCALLDDGSIACWGSNNYGQLGDGTTTDRHTPTQTASLGAGRTAVAISSAGVNACAVLDDGSVACWGSNYYGQLGDGTTTDRHTPTQTASLGAGRAAVAITTTTGVTCVILDDRHVSCWGRNAYGQLGDGTTTDQHTPTLPATGMISLDAGRTASAISVSDASYTCALLDDGSVVCWGRNTLGQLGDGTTTNRDTPTQTASLGAGRTAVAISAGNDQTCAILDDGSVACWGSNQHGQLGDGTTTDRHTPTQTASLGAGRTAVAISAGEYHTCAVLDDGSVACWGTNANGRLGDGTSDAPGVAKPTPVSVLLPNGRTANSISSGPRTHLRTP